MRALVLVLCLLLPAGAQAGELEMLALERQLRFEFQQETARLNTTIDSLQGRIEQLERNAPLFLDDRLRRAETMWGDILLRLVKLEEAMPIGKPPQLTNDVIQIKIALCNILRRQPLKGRLFAEVEQAANLCFVIQPGDL